MEKVALITGITGMEKKCCIVCFKTFSKCSGRINKHLSYSQFKLKKFCSKKCHIVFNRGVDAGNYKNGFSVRNGYIIDNYQNKYLHRIKFENKIGRKLRRFEVVHHKNGNRKDNRISNLELLDICKHTSIHVKNRPRKKNGMFLSV